MVVTYVWFSFYGFMRKGSEFLGHNEKSVRNGSKWLNIVLVE